MHLAPFTDEQQEPTGGILSPSLVMESLRFESLMDRTGFVGLNSSMESKLHVSRAELLWVQHGMLISYTKQALLWDTRVRRRVHM